MITLHIIAQEEVTIEELATLDKKTDYYIKLSLWGIKMSDTNEEFIKQKRVDGLSKVKLLAPSVDGGPDRKRCE